MTGTRERLGLKRGFNCYAVETRNQVAVLNADRAAFGDVQVITDPPAPLVQQSMQHVQVHDQQQAQERIQFQAQQALAVSACGFRAGASARLS